MSVIIRMQKLSWAASAADVREFFSGLVIPDGGVHIVGGKDGDAFIAFATDEDARQAMAQDNRKLKEVRVKLLLSSRMAMQRVIEKARSEFAAAQEELSRSRDRDKRVDKQVANPRRSRSRSPTGKTGLQPVSGYQSFPAANEPVGYNNGNFKNDSYAATIGEVRPIPLSNSGDPYTATFMGADRTGVVVDRHQQQQHYPIESRSLLMETGGYGGRNIDSFPMRKPDSFASVDRKLPLLESQKPFMGGVEPHQPEYLASLDGMNIVGPPVDMSDRRGFDRQQMPNFNSNGFGGGVKQPLMGYGGISADPASFPPAVQLQLGRQRRPLLDSIPTAKLPEVPVPSVMSGGAFPRGFHTEDMPRQPYPNAMQFNEPPMQGPFASAQSDRFTSVRQFNQPSMIDGQFGRNSSDLVEMPLQMGVGSRFPSQNPFEEAVGGSFTPQNFDAAQFLDGMSGGGNMRQEQNFHPGSRVSAAQRRDIFLRLTNIPPDYRSYSALREFFSPLNLAGFDRIKILCNERRERIGTAYVHFATFEECEEALRRNGRLCIQIDRCTEAEFLSAVDGGIIPGISARPINGSGPGRNTPPERQPLRRESSQTRLRRDGVDSPDGAMVLLVENVAYVTRENEIMEVMRKGGANVITIATEFRKENSKLRTGNLFVELATEEDLQAALKCNQQVVNGRTIRLIRSSAREMLSRTGVKVKRPKSTSRSPLNGPSPSIQQPSERRLSVTSDPSRSPCTCVFASNLPFSVSEREVAQFFGALRIASVKVMSEPRGSAYVEFQTDYDAESAISYNRKPMGNRPAMVVLKSREEMLEAIRLDEKRTSLKAQSYPDERPDVSDLSGRRGCLLALHNLPLDVTLEDLQGFFDGYELVKDTVMMHYDNSGNPTGDCLVTIASTESARRAVEKLDGKLLNGKAVVIYPAS